MATIYIHEDYDYNLCLGFLHRFQGRPIHDLASFRIQISANRNRNDYRIGNFGVQPHPGCLDFLHPQVCLGTAR